MRWAAVVLLEALPVLYHSPRSHGDGSSADDRRQEYDTTDDNDRASNPCNVVSNKWKTNDPQYSFIMMGECESVDFYILFSPSVVQQGLLPYDVCRWRGSVVPNSAPTTSPFRARRRCVCFVWVRWVGPLRLSTAVKCQRNRCCIGLTRGDAMIMYTPE